MIRSIQAINYRSLKQVDVTLANFNVLVGPNASGKSTFLSVLSFLSDFVSSGLDAAIQKTGTEDIHDLVWGRIGNRFELGVEATIPEVHRSTLYSPDMETVRYQVAIGLDEERNELCILQERIVLASSADSFKDEKLGVSGFETLFQRLPNKPASVRLVANLDRSAGEWHTILENPTLYPDETVGQYYRLVPRSSIFQSLGSGHRYPVAIWLGNLLRDCIQRVELQSEPLRLASPAGKGNTPSKDGSNLPWVVHNFQKDNAGSNQDWVAHLRTAVPDLANVRVEFNRGKNERYLMLRFAGGLEVPSWMLSDGTLRLLALTILAYLPGPKPIYLIEEPENSIHPMNVETVLQSLQSVYDGQVLVTTHSPAVVAMTDADKVLVFAREEEAGTRIVSGDKHPALREWKGEVSLGTLFAGGVLG